MRLPVSRAEYSMKRRFDGFTISEHTATNTSELTIERDEALYITTEG